MTALAANLEKVEKAIAAACRRAGRPRTEVELMAVSKTYPAETIAEAVALGLTLFGENRVQEFAAKAIRARAASPRSAPPRPPHRPPAIQQVSPRSRTLRCHRRSRLSRLAERLNDAAAKLGKRLPILVEVKLSPEETKAGLTARFHEAAQLLEALPSLTTSTPAAS